MHSQSARRVAITLALIATASIWLRYYMRCRAAAMPSDTVWRLTYTIECESARAGAQVSAAIPYDTPHAHVVRQDVRAVNFQIAPLTQSTSANRNLVAVAEAAGDSRLALQLDIHLSPASVWPFSDPLGAIAEGKNSTVLKGVDRTASPLVTEKLNLLRKGATNPAQLVTRVFTFCRALSPLDDRDAPNDADGTLIENQGSPRGRARAMIALCQAGGVPARQATGFELHAADIATPTDWVEVLLDGRWTSYDPARNWQGELPHNALPVCHNSNIVTAQNTRAMEAEFSIQQLPPGSGPLSFERGNLAVVLDLTRLPLEMQPVLSLILLMPFGALITCVFRNLVGVKTSGTFAPMLLAMSFVLADWRAGLAVLIAVVILGFATRNWLDSLQLLMLPRLSIVLTFIVCCIVLGVSLSEYWHVAPAAGAVFLPLVILTMIVERFFISTQEDGVSVAVQHLAGTLVVGACCFAILRWEAIARWVLTYPEVHFGTAAILVLLGRYTGYQLLELWRFRPFVEP
jgi:hypothetical protein